MTLVRMRRRVGLIVAGLLVGCGAVASPASPREYDTALALAVDVSGSVDEERYRIQMEGIARALEDEEVVKSILGGEHGAIMISMLAWSDTSRQVLPWQPIASREDAQRVADAVRSLPHVSGEFTCMARMFISAREDTFQGIPGRPRKLVLDVSGDGPDNCSGARRTEEERDKLISEGVTVNGLPIRSENDYIGTGAYRAPGFGWEELKREPHMLGVTIEDWYSQHVIGGPAAFLVPANGYEDFDRAFRKKFVTEISAAPARRVVAETSGHSR